MNSVLIGVAAGIVFAVFVNTPGPGRRLRHWLLYQRGRTARRGGQAVVAVRVVAGSQAGLDEGWCRGVAVVRPGRLDFARYAGGLALVKRPVPPIDLIAIGTAERLRPGDSYRLDPDCEVVPLRTATGMLQLAVLPPLPGALVFDRLRWPGAPYC